MKEISPIKRAALTLIDNFREIILTECDDDEIADSLVRINPENNGYIKEQDYLTADAAMRILRMGTNRNKFFALMRKKNIKNHKINNQHVGFLRRDIERISREIHKSHS